MAHGGWRVLVVEDEPGARELLRSLLESDGYQVRTVDNGHAALVEATTFRPHLALLDSGLPGLDGQTVARRLKEQSQVAVIFVSGADSPESRRGGLRAGADDYVTKPFDPEELSLRVRRVLERTGHKVARIWQVGDLVVDEAAQRVMRAGSEVMLTATELTLLYALGRRPGRPVTKRQLLEEVWGWADETSNVVESHISSLRRKLEAYGPSIIRTRRGIGYVLNVDA